MRRVGIRPPAIRRRALAGFGIAVLAAALAGCVSGSPANTPNPTKAAPNPSGSATAQLPEINLTGSANQNRPYFDAVNEKFIAAGGDLTGRPFIDNLVKAGYPKADMEVTRDRTSVNLAADSIQFSIRFGTTCLIGQYGNVGYASAVTSALQTGRCLVGDTRPIDW